MFKTLKWAYKLGKLHERRRIKLMIVEHMDAKPEPPLGNVTDIAESNYRDKLHIWNEVQYVLNKITTPEPQLYSPPETKAPIDEDEL